MSSNTFRRKPKVVLQYDSRGVFMNRFYSAAFAARELNIDYIKLMNSLDTGELYENCFFWTPENIHISRQKKLF